MAIQGIIQGFANPANTAKNVIMVGRGDSYIVLVDGVPDQTCHGLHEAAPRFWEKAKALCGAHWLQVVEIRAHSVGLLSVVVKLRDVCFDAGDAKDRVNC